MECPWCHCHACLCPAMLIGFKLISNSQGRLVMDFYENIKSFIKKICNETEGKLVGGGGGKWARDTQRAKKRNKLLYVSFWREWGAGHFTKPVRKFLNLLWNEHFRLERKIFVQAVWLFWNETLGICRALVRCREKKTIKHAVIKFAFAIFSLPPPRDASLSENFFPPEL